MINAEITDLPAALIKQFELRTIRLIGDPPNFYNQLKEKLGEYPIEDAGEEDADVTFIDDYGEDPLVTISEAYEGTKQDGFLCGSKYDHQNIEVQNALSSLYNLMYVNVGPAGVWSLRK